MPQTLAPASPASADTAVETYLVVWSGGYEDPAYEAFADADAAQAKAAEWAADASSDSRDTIQVLRITAAPGQPPRVDVHADVF